MVVLALVDLIPYPALSLDVETADAAGAVAPPSPVSLADSGEKRKLVFFTSSLD
jgi:hypothetical protein